MNIKIHAIELKGLCFKRSVNMFGLTLLLLISTCANISGHRHHSDIWRTKNEVPSYKISMIESNEHRGSPALFTHGESPVWDPDTQNLYFVDVLEQNVHRLHYETGQIFTKHIGYGQVNVVALVFGSRRLLVAVRAGLYLLDWDVVGDAGLRLLATVDNGMPDNVINDGKADAQGRYWAGTKGPQIAKDVEPDQAALYSFEQATLPIVRTQIKPVSISNGIAWAPNNTVMYYVDSPTKRIDAFDFDLQNGRISNRRPILDITDVGFNNDEIPDGMTVDSEGHIWVAIMFGGAVLQIDPDTRTLVYTYKMPASRVTSVCWGGPQLDELFVTSSRLGDRREPSGAVFTVRGTGRRGLPPDRFRFERADGY